MDEFFHSILKGASLSALLAAVGTIANRLVVRLFAKSGTRSWGAAVGLSLGFAAAYLAMMGLPAFPPSEGSQWLPIFALVAGVEAGVEGTFCLKRWFVWTLRALLTASILGITLYSVSSAWTPRALVLLFVGLEVVTLAIWAALEPLAAKSTGAAVPASFTVSAFGLIFVAFGAHYTMLALWAAGLMTGLAACTVAMLGSKRLSFAHGGVGVALMLLFAVSLAGYFYADMRAVCPFLLIAGPLALWLGRIGPIARMARWQRAIILTLAVLLPVGTAAYLANSESEPAAGSEES
jgi:hypothetical protein